MKDPNDVDKPCGMWLRASKKRNQLVQGNNWLRNSRGEEVAGETAVDGEGSFSEKRIGGDVHGKKLDGENLGGNGDMGEIKLI